MHINIFQSNTVWAVKRGVSEVNYMCLEGGDQSLEHCVGKASHQRLKDFIQVLRFNEETDRLDMANSMYWYGHCLNV